ncbi:hypothetical protein AC578_10178 [Pseudocercospora eumusae]|uniref:Piwi domain-containing protein n=1 Tax=Pseudocercospora eumusae TaxID=321146 RepID=A0A139HYU1_9PEZI|nr:hypothetical protein AC578_10178 [Pseudocercospora eumusae]
MNLKLGGVNHSIPASNFGAILPEKTMFVGLDVTYPSPGSTSSALSVASIVSSVNRTLGHNSSLRSKKGNDHRSDRAILRTIRVVAVKKQNLASQPYSLSRWLILDNELPAIKKAISNIYSPAEVKQGVLRLLIIVVGKRHHTRFYLTKEEDADNTGNSKHGLVVDRGDFFLQAHSALHGTTKPAYYYVIYDETSVADALEKMTHGLCYLFGRATLAVSICPPAYYADLVCERARCYLSKHFALSSGSATLASELSSSVGVFTAGV